MYQAISGFPLSVVASRREKQLLEEIRRGEANTREKSLFIDKKLQESMAICSDIVLK